jgi:hypothetical protein
MKNRLHHMHVVRHAQLVWNHKQNGIGLGDCLVLSQLLDENIRFSSVPGSGNCNWYEGRSGSSDLWSAEAVDLKRSIPPARVRRQSGPLLPSRLPTTSPAVDECVGFRSGWKRSALFRELTLDTAQ